MSVKKISNSDLLQVVNIHNKSFRNFFLTDLGSSFLATYYKSINNHSKGILLGWYKDNVLCGFCAASTVSKGFNKELIKKNLSQFSYAAIKLLFTKPKALVRLAKNLTKKKDGINDDTNYAELFSIAIDPAMQGRGIGKELIFELEKQLKEQGTQNLSLTTDLLENDKTLAFYKNAGYTVYYDFIAYPNRKMYRLIKQLSS